MKGQCAAVCVRVGTRVSGHVVCVGSAPGPQAWPRLSSWQQWRRAAVRWPWAGVRGRPDLWEAGGALGPPAPRLLLETGVTLFCLAPRLPSTSPPPPPGHLLTSDPSHPSPSTQEASAFSPLLWARVQKWGQVSPVWPPGRTAGQSRIQPAALVTHSLTVCIHVCACMHTCVCLTVCIRVCLTVCIHACVCVYTRVCLFVYMHMPVCVYIRVHRVVCIHVCMTETGRLSNWPQASWAVAAGHRWPALR